MIGERTENALSRIRAALDRIDAAGVKAEAAACKAAETAMQEARKHDALRAAVAETLRDLDQLIQERTA